MSIKEGLKPLDYDYDCVKCAKRDHDGNPLELRFYRNGNLIGKQFFKYDSNGDWKTIWWETVEESKKKEDAET